MEETGNQKIQTQKEKKMAGEAAAALIEEGMIIGLGTGSTVAFFLEALGHKIRDGMTVRGIPTSKWTAARCRQLGIVLLENLVNLDLAVDGADEIDSQFRMIKGGGGALLREKIIAELSRQVIIIVDSQKVVDSLGGFPLPVEVVPFGYQYVQRRLLSDLKIRATLRFSGQSPYVTDNGNYILDCTTGFIHHPEELSTKLNDITGVVASGLFLSHCDTLVIGKGNETILQHAKCTS